VRFLTYPWHYIKLNGTFRKRERPFYGRAQFVSIGATLVLDSLQNAFSRAPSERGGGARGAVPNFIPVKAATQTWSPELFVSNG